MKLLSIFKAISFLTTKICISTVIYLKYTNIHIHITHTWNENISIYRIIILHNRLFTLLCVYPYLNIIIVSWNACKVYNHWTMILILRLKIFSHFNMQGLIFPNSLHTILSTLCSLFSAALLDRNHFCILSSRFFCSSFT